MELGQGNFRLGYQEKGSSQEGGQALNKFPKEWSKAARAPGVF